MLSLVVENRQLVVFPVAAFAKECFTNLLLTGIGVFFGGEKKLDYPGRWLEIVKNGMKDVVPAFDSNRMAIAYYEKMYLA